MKSNKNYSTKYFQREILYQSSFHIQDSIGTYPRSVLRNNRYGVGLNEKEDNKEKVTSSNKSLDPMAYEMELNRIDFKNDVSSST